MSHKSISRDFFLIGLIVLVSLVIVSYRLQAAQSLEYTKNRHQRFQTVGSGKIEGQIWLSENLKLPMSGAVVILNDSSLSDSDPKRKVSETKADEDGKYSFTDVKPGAYVLTILWPPEIPSGYSTCKFPNQITTHGDWSVDRVTTTSTNAAGTKVGFIVIGMLNKQAAIKVREGESQTKNLDFNTSCYRPGEAPTELPPTKAPTENAAAFTHQVEYIATVGVKEHPIAIGVNSVVNVIYVSNFGDGTVSVIDVEKNTVIATVSVGEFPNGIVVHPEMNTVYVANNYDGTVTIMDAKTNVVTSTVEVASSADDIALNPAQNVLYVASDQDKTVTLLDGKTKVVGSTIQLQNGASDLVYNETNSTIYVSSYADGVISVIDAKTKTVVKVIQVADCCVTGLAVNPITNKVYVINESDVYIIDGSTNTIVNTINNVGGAIRKPSEQC
jgi:YVTN family beta-propeller protein